MRRPIMITATKQRLLERATKLLGHDELARRLNVPTALLKAWMRGDTTMPDSQLLNLARVMDDLSQKKDQ
jgi:DNA-binding transcriptional regulator YiaG